jgi:hypothetical protein
MRIREEEAEDPSLCKAIEPIRLARQTMKHEGRTQGILSRKTDNEPIRLVNKARYAWDEENYKAKEKEMGALWFTRRVRRMRVPKGFKLPHDQQKYDGSQEPKLWLSDYLQAV